MLIPEFTEVGHLLVPRYMVQNCINRQTLNWIILNPCTIVCRLYIIYSSLNIHAMENVSETLCSTITADPSARAVQDVGLRPLYCWACGFEYRWGHGYSSVVFDGWCIGSGLFDELIIRSEESYRQCVCVCVFPCLIQKPPQWSCFCSSWTVRPQENIITVHGANLKWSLVFVDPCIIV